MKGTMDDTEEPVEEDETADDEDLEAKPAPVPAAAAEDARAAAAVDDLYRAMQQVKPATAAASAFYQDAAAWRDNGVLTLLACRHDERA